MNGEDPVKQWSVVCLTGLFVVLYVMGVTGVPWSPNDAILKVVHPILAVIIGYYFGRMPSERTEQTLKREITRTTQEATAAKAAQVEAERNATRQREKVENAKSVLVTSAPPDHQTPQGFAHVLAGGGDAVSADALRYSVAAALRVLGG